MSCCFDSEFVVQYLNRPPGSAAHQYLKQHDNEAFFVPLIVLHEVYQGEVHSSGPPEFKDVDKALNWASIPDMTSRTVLETARLQNDLRKRGVPLSPFDALVAGVAREQGARVVSNDSDFHQSGVQKELTVDSY